MVIAGIDKIKFNLIEICKIASKDNVVIILMQIRIPPNYGRIYTQAFESMYGEVANEMGILLVPFMLKNIALEPNLMLPDGIHPNEEGQPLIVEEIYKWLEFL